MTKYKIERTVRFKKDFKSIKKRGYDVKLLAEVVENTLKLYLTRTGTHSDLF